MLAIVQAGEGDTFFEDASANELEVLSLFSAEFSGIGDGRHISPELSFFHHVHTIAQRDRGRAGASTKRQSANQYYGAFHLDPPLIIFEGLYIIYGQVSIREKYRGENKRQHLLRDDCRLSLVSSVGLPSPNTRVLYNLVVANQYPNN